MRAKPNAVTLGPMTRSSEIYFIGPTSVLDSAMVACLGFVATNGPRWQHCGTGHSELSEMAPPWIDATRASPRKSRAYPALDRIVFATSGRWPGRNKTKV